MEENLAYPMLFFPKKWAKTCTHILNPSTEMNVKITSSSIGSPHNIIYTGVCTIKVLDCNNNDEEIYPSVNASADLPKVAQIYQDNWIESLIVNNQFDIDNGFHVSQDDNNTHTIQDGTNYQDEHDYNGQDDADTYSSSNFKHIENFINSESFLNINDEDTIDFSSSDVGEVVINSQPKAPENINSIEYSENEVLKQLKSAEIPSSSKHRHMIGLLGKDSSSGQALHIISYTDPTFKCALVTSKLNVDLPTENINKKKYQCDKCKQIFDQISAFRQHIVGENNSYNPNSECRYKCFQCVKSLKNQKKFELHCSGHGDPNVECPKCHKVYASKFSLRNHLKIHDRKYPCNCCARSYATERELKTHLNKNHVKYTCKIVGCGYFAYNKAEMDKHSYGNHVSLDEGHVTLDEGHVTLDEGHVTLDEGHVTLDEGHVTLDEGHVILDEGHVTLDEGHVTLDEGHVTLDEGHVTLDEGHVTLDDGHMTLDEGHVILDESQVILDENDVPQDTKVADYTTYIDGATYNVVQKTKNRMKFKKEDSDDDDWALSSLRKTVNVTGSKETDSQIAEVISSEVFRLDSKKVKKHTKNHKSCKICSKIFNRISDLKRHLIEHLVRWILSQNPVGKNGTLRLVCVVCRTEVFDKVDLYKAHLREHAKLTVYQCAFCYKSFSDSSNFSKHKKTHGLSFYQCDLCLRKFNSKKMMTQHMEYHKENAPLECECCDRTFHFKSMLNKHVKLSHHKGSISKFKCKFCGDTFKSLKDKWDHEWVEHKVRKKVVDCMICDSKFRKYSELKKHSLDLHYMPIPRTRDVPPRLKKKNTYTYNYC